MLLRPLNVGAVTLLKNFRNPINIARKVLTDSPHALLGGEGAKIFALEKSFEAVPQKSLISQRAKDNLYDFLIESQTGGRGTEDRIEDGFGTVGAIAVDAQGHIASASSSGGINGKSVGRISDTPQIGSGTYTDDYIGGVSATGHGESILKFCLSYTIIKLMEKGIDAQTATKEAVNAMTARLHNTAGAISLSKNGDVGFHFSTKRLAWAYVKNEKVFYGVERDEILQEELN